MGISNPVTAESIGAVPATRALLAGANITVNGDVEANLETDITIAGTGGGGGDQDFELIAFLTEPTAGEFVFTGIDPSGLGFNCVLVVIENLKIIDTDAVPIFTLEISGVEIVAGYDYSSSATNSAGTADINSAVAATSVLLLADTADWQIAAGSDGFFSGQILFTGVGSIFFDKAFTWNGVVSRTVTPDNCATVSGGGVCRSPGFMTGLKISATDTNCDNGTVKLYGYRSV